jgi:hypothetical protein
MAEVSKPLAQVLVDAIVRAVAEHPAVPAENRAAFYAVGPRLVQETIRSVLGCDSVQLTGWVIVPSERLARRDRILRALEAGEAPARIASRELVSVRWVRKLRQEVGGTGAP